MRNLFPWSTGIFAELNNIVQDTFQQLDHYRDYGTEDYQLYSTPEGWIAKVDLPGYAKEDVSLNFSDSALALKADNEARGAYELRFSLGDDVEVTGIAAKLENGALTLTLPKKEVTEPVSKAIEIQ